MKRYSIIEREDGVEREIGGGGEEVGGIHPWWIAIGICLWLAVLIELVVRAVIRL